MTPRQLAEAFCEMNDEQQAQFFIECADIAQTTWGVSTLDIWHQWYRVGRHLRDCTCSTHEARQMITNIYSGTES